MFRYAQIDVETGEVLCDSCLSGEVIAENMIPVSDDFDLTNKKYINGEWLDYEPEPIVPQPTQLDRIEEQQLILMEAQAEQYEQGLENRLNDMEVQATMYEAILALGGEV